MPAGLTPRFAAYASALAERYRQAAPTWPRWHGHCDELAGLALAVAHEMNMRAELSVTRIWSKRDRCYTLHSVAVVEGMRVHSPQPGVVELSG
jgi:hypothetical protein